MSFRKTAEGFGKAVVRSFAGLGLLTATGIAGTQYLIYSQAKKKQEFPSQGVVLHFDLSIPLVEKPPTPWENLTNPRPPIHLRSLIKAIEKASNDNRVRGIICTFGTDYSPSPAISQEVADAIMQFRKVQKDQAPEVQRFAWASADTFGESMQGTGQYYLASAFEKVYMQPTGRVGLIGLSFPSYFYKKLLAKIGIEPQFFTFYEYKNAANQFTQEGFTPHHREQMEKICDSLFTQIVSGIADRRNLPLDQVKKAVDKASLDAKEATEMGLIDGIMYPDQVQALTKDAKLLGMRQYIKALEKAEKKFENPLQGETNTKPKIALITAQGPIIRGMGDPTSRNPEIPSERIKIALRAAAKDDTVKAIVVRVDSPGGSAVASDSIRREMERARELGKPVVVSMGSVAASGGYYMATGADKVLAQPGTITGSIGVIAGRFNIYKLLDQLGIGFDHVSRGEEAGSMNAVYPWNEKQAKKIEGQMVKVYEEFTGHVMKARKLTAKQVDALARGRVWTGLQAKELNLVDELGGLNDAHKVAGQLAGIEEKDLPSLVAFPKTKSGLEKVASALAGETDNDATVYENTFPSLVHQLFEGSGLGEVAEVWIGLANAGSMARKAHASTQQSTSLTMEYDFQQ